MDLNLTAPINQLGYGIVGLNVLASLRRLGHDPALWILGHEETPETHISLVDAALEKAASYDKMAPSLRIWHQFDLAQHVGKGIHCALPIFELDTFRPIEKHHLLQQDRVYAPSHWAAKVLVNNDIPADRIGYAPFGVDQDIFFPRDVDYVNGGPTIFLNIGKWELRKGHDLIVSAFNKAFAPSDNVRLVMLCYNPCFSDPSQLKRYNEQWQASYERSPLGNKIEIARHRLPTQHHVADIMASADCGIFPARAEGWNLELAEMLAMGKTCIASNCTAHTEFITLDNCLLIEPGPLQDAYDGVWFMGQGKWHSMGDDQIDQLVTHMRHVHNLKQDGDKLRNQAGIESMRRFTWDNTVRELLSGLG